MITRSLTNTEIVVLAPRLLRLQYSAYAVAAALIGDDRIPPFHESEQELISARFMWCVSFDGEGLAGAIGYVIEDDVVDIDRLMIAPGYHRQGVGSGLVARVLPLAPGSSFRPRVTTFPHASSTSPLDSSTTATSSLSRACR